MSYDAIDAQLRRRRRIVWWSGLAVVALSASCAGWVLARLGVQWMEAL